MSEGRTASTLDIWWDDEGCWREIDGELLGPLESEKEAEEAESGN